MKKFSKKDWLLIVFVVVPMCGLMVACCVKYVREEQAAQRKLDERMRQLLRPMPPLRIPPPARVPAPRIDNRSMTVRA